MEQISYIFYATVAMALFLLGYWLLMRREVRHQMVRFYLLGSLVLALLVPLSPKIQVTAPIESTPTTERIEAEQTVYYDQPAEAGQIQKAEPRPVIANKPIEEQFVDLGWVLTEIFWCQILGGAYLIGCGLMLILLIVRLVRLGVMLRRFDYTQHDGYRLALTDGDQPAFSFLRTIVIGRNGFSNAEIEQLLGHELVHVRRRHTLDILFCELVAWLPDLMGDFKGLSSWMDIAWHVAYHARAALLMLLAAMVASRLLHKLDHHED